MIKIANTQLSSERGETLLGMLAGLVLGSIVMSAAVVNFSDAWRHSSDIRMVAQAQTEARSLLDIMAYDLRMLGTGMPLGQTGFAVDDVTLGAAALPILTTSTTSSITFRLNEEGTNTVLTSDYLPSSSNLSLAVVSSTGFSVGDTIYISNVSSGGTGGFQGTVTSMTSTSLSLSSTYTTTPATTFQSGSIVERVSTVTFTSTSGSSGVTRGTGGTPVLLSPRSSFSVRYLDSNGVELTLPLTATTIRSNLASVEITVEVMAPHALVNGTWHTSEAKQTVALRNLLLVR